MVSPRPKYSQQQRGFSLFELVVFILSVAIIYSYAAQRFSTYPSDAEKANFEAVTAQLQSSITLQSYNAQVRGDLDGLRQSLVGANPMLLMLRPPRNYLGEISNANVETLSRRSWYFDVDKGELVYLIGSGEHVLLMGPNGLQVADEIRLSIVAEYSEIERSTGLPVSLIRSRSDRLSRRDIVLRFDGLILNPVTPFKWVGDLTDEERSGLAVGLSRSL